MTTFRVRSIVPVALVTLAAMISRLFIPLAFVAAVGMFNDSVLQSHVVLASNLMLKMIFQLVRHRTIVA